MVLQHLSLLGGQDTRWKILARLNLPLALALQAKDADAIKQTQLEVAITQPRSAYLNQ